MTDPELISGCVEGKKRSWDEFVRRFSRLIYWSIHRALDASPFGGRADLVEEIFQEVFLRLVQKEELSKLREASSIRKFLTVMACHAAMDKMKSLSRFEKRTLLPSQEADESRPADEPWTGIAETSTDGPVKNEERVILEDVLEELSPKERACFEFHHLDGKTHKEIGEILGLPQDTVSTILRRSKAKLQERLRQKGFLE